MDVGSVTGREDGRRVAGIADTRLQGRVYGSAGRRFGSRVNLPKIRNAYTCTRAGQSAGYSIFLERPQLHRPIAHAVAHPSHAAPRVEHGVLHVGGARLPAHDAAEQRAVVVGVAAAVGPLAADAAVADRRPGRAVGGREQVGEAPLGAAAALARGVDAAAGCITMSSRLHSPPSSQPNASSASAAATAPAARRRRGRRG